jgi:hypothetical protein
LRAWNVAGGEINARGHPGHPKATGTMTVKACAGNLQSIADPVSTNNCKTLKLSIS